MYYYREGTHSVGPFTSEKLIELRQKDIIHDQTLIRATDSEAWFEYAVIARLAPVTQPAAERREPMFPQAKPEPAPITPPAPPSPQITPEPVPAETPHWVLTPVAPWRRYFARMFDLTVFGLIAWALIGYAWFSSAPLQADQFFNQLNPIMDSVLTLALGSLVSGLVLGFIGTTPGKFIFGIRVKTLHGRNVGIVNGIARDLQIFLKGLGLGIPLVSFVTLIVAYRHLTKNQTMSWDEGRYVVTYRHNSGVQITMTIVGILLYLCVLTLIWAINRSL